MPRTDERPVGNWAALGPAVRDARNRAGLTQKAVADAAGVSRGWLIRFEAGLPNAAPVTVLRVLRVVDLELAVRPDRRGDSGAPGNQEFDLDAYVDGFVDDPGLG